ncbi:MAG: type II secretion system F family protein, partial [Planctomycetota bacterium]
EPSRRVARSGRYADERIASPIASPTRLLGSGKESTELARACDVVSRHYEREAEHRAASMSSLVEPLMTVLLACVVLTLALSVFMPMWQLMQVGSQ